jgi:DNA-binding beta-propeller fold protein YncE
MFPDVVLFPEAFLFRKFFLLKTATLATLLLLAPALGRAQQAEPIHLLTTIALPGVTGKFDHFAIDESKDRLFVAATGNHSVEVIDLKSGKVEQSISGLGKPHGLAWVGSSKSLYVADGSLAELRWYQGEPLKLAGTLKLSDDADDMVYSEATQRLYVGHGGSDAANPASIAVVDTASFTLKRSISVATHPEALDMDASGNRIFANIAEASEVAVVDGSTDSIAAHWKLSKAADNVPMAYDGNQGVLFLATRTPAMVIALDGSNGAELSRLPTGSGADDLFFDPEQHRVYVICGAGKVDIYQVDANKSLHSAGEVATEAGAKTALFVAAQSKLYVGIPGTAGHPAEIEVYSTQSQRQQP